jgi:hypothetical protein
MPYTELTLHVPPQMMMDSAVKSKVRLRIQKAQDTRKALKLRLSQAKKDYVLANEALDAAMAVYEMEVQELQRIESLKEETQTMAKGYRAVGMFSNILAVKVRLESPLPMLRARLANLRCAFWCNRRDLRQKRHTHCGRKNTRRPHWRSGHSQRNSQRPLTRSVN